MQIQFFRRLPRKFISAPEWDGIFVKQTVTSKWKSNLQTSYDSSISHAGSNVFDLVKTFRLLYKKFVDVAKLDIDFKWCGTAAASNVSARHNDLLSLETAG